MATILPMKPRSASAEDAAAFEQRLTSLQPALQRYCARMTGSVFDAEDVVQDALARALAAWPDAQPDNVEAWLFRIAHNAAIDFLRARHRRGVAVPLDEAELIAVAPPPAASMALRTFMQLPPQQRSCVILKDVLGHSIEETGGIIGASIAAVKAALHRGRARLRVLGEVGAPLPSGAELQRLSAYVDRFNARDFDAVVAMLAEDVVLDLVARARRRGRTAVSDYFTNYAKKTDWRLAVGLVDGRLAVLVSDPADPSAAPAYAVRIDWRGRAIARIRDLRYAREAMMGAEIALLAR